jgi:hypothetical protein
MSAVQAVAKLTYFAANDFLGAPKVSLLAVEPQCTE